MRWTDYRLARERMVREQLVAQGIRDRRVLRVMMRIPRHRFLGPDAGIEAYADHSVPIGFRQTMSSPWMVAYLCEQLRLRGDETVLEIGTGSGYQAAILSMLCDHVYSVERVARLAERARRALVDCICPNVTVRVGDGAEGWPEHAPFDRILMTAASDRLPEGLLQQLRDGGLLVAPVRRGDGRQEIVRLVRDGSRVHVERLGECQFVPLQRGVVVVADADAGGDRGAVGRGE